MGLVPKERQFARALDSDGARQDFRSPSPPLSSSDGGAERPALGEAVLRGSRPSHVGACLKYAPTCY